MASHVARVSQVSSRPRRPLGRRAAPARQGPRTDRPMRRRAHQRGGSCVHAFASQRSSLISILRELQPNRRRSYPNRWIGARRVPHSALAITRSAKRRRVHCRSGRAIHKARVSQYSGTSLCMCDGEHERVLGGASRTQSYGKRSTIALRMLCGAGERPCPDLKDAGASPISSSIDETSAMNSSSSPGRLSSYQMAAARSTARASG